MSLSEAGLKELGLKYKNLIESEKDFNIIFINNHNLKIIISSKSLKKIFNLNSITPENSISLINLSIYHQSEVKAVDEGNTKNFSEYIQTKPLFGINFNDRLRILINKFSLEYILQLQNLDFEDLLSYISLDVVEEIENEYKEVINKSRTITEFNHKSLKQQNLENNNDTININNNKEINKEANNNEINNNEVIINYNNDVKSKKFIKSKVFFRDFNPCLKNIGKILENIVKSKDIIREKANNYLNNKNNEISKIEPNFIRKVYLKKVINVIKKKNQIKVFDIHGNQVIINKRDIDNYDENKIYILIKDNGNNKCIVSLEDLKNKIKDWGLLEKNILLKNEENNQDIEIKLKNLDFPQIFMENMEKHYQMNEEFELEKNKDGNNENKEENNNDNNLLEEKLENKNEEDISEKKEINDEENKINSEEKIENNKNEDKEEENKVDLEKKEENNKNKIEEKEINLEENKNEDKIEEKEINLEENNDNNQKENIEIETKENEKENEENNFSHNNKNTYVHLKSIQEKENEDEDNENENENNNVFETPIDYGSEDKNKNIIVDEIPIEENDIIDDGKYEEPKTSNENVTLTSLNQQNKKSDNNSKLKHRPNNLSFDQNSNINKNENIIKKKSSHRRLVSTPNPLFKMNLNFETAMKMRSGQIGRPIKIRREIYMVYS